MRAQGRAGAPSGALCGSEQPVLLLYPRPVLSMAALGLCSGDSRVFNQSSGTRDSPANASRPRERLCSGPVPPKAAPSPGAGRKASTQLLHLLARGPGPRPVAHAHSPAGSPHAPAASALGLWQLCPPQDNPPSSSSSSCCFHNLLLSPPGGPRGSLCLLRAPKCCLLQPASERFCHGACPGLARSLTSLLLLLLLPFGLGLARGGRGEAPGPQG